MNFHVHINISYGKIEEIKRERERRAYLLLASPWVTAEDAWCLPAPAGGGRGRRCCRSTRGRWPESGRRCCGAAACPGRVGAAWRSGALRAAPRGRGRAQAGGEGGAPAWCRRSWPEAGRSAAAPCGPRSVRQRAQAGERKSKRRLRGGGAQMTDAVRWMFDGPVVVSGSVRGGHPGSADGIQRPGTGQL